MEESIMIYLAAPWVDRELAKTVRSQFEAAGIVVNSRWLDIEDTPLEEISLPERRYRAMIDIEDVLNSSILVLLNTKISEGKSVETGIAIATGKGIVIVGKPSNVFHYLNIPLVETVEEAIDVVKHYPWTASQLQNSVFMTEEAESKIVLANG